MHRRVSDRPLPVHEQFVSLQGEGRLVGTPSTFIRVAGCNLRCLWCDSPHTSWDPQSEATSLDDLVEICAEGPRHVVLTGGEPLLFPSMASLSHRLRDRGHHVTVETAGTVWLEDLVCDLASISPKLAHSTPVARDPAWTARHEDRRWNPQVVSRLMNTQPWQLKFVVRGQLEPDLREDLQEIDRMVAALGVDAVNFDHVLLMPECTDPARLSRDYETLVPVCRARGYRLGERLHIAIFGHTPGT